MFGSTVDTSRKQHCLRAASSYSDSLRVALRRWKGLLVRDISTGEVTELELRWWTEHVPVSPLETFPTVFQVWNLTSEYFHTKEEMLVALFCFFSLNSHLENWGFACNDSPIQPPASQTIQFMQDNLLEQVEFKVILQFNEHNLLRIFKILHLLRATLPTMWGKKLPRDNAYRPGGTQSQKRPRLVNGAPWGS
ncbi:hypothetical protein HID58_035431 [Brassica napus]|uniref:Uncharacterized protein n=1 Tax=Brassica napus TaxID=3708 RepID=A0ABQ8C4W2_BRANA|nr:hypothetical protein HID58_035431 [Brassica napus]